MISSNILNALDFTIDKLKESPFIWYSINAGIAIALSCISFFITRLVLKKVIIRLIRNSKTVWDDYLLNRKFFHKISFFAPAIVLYYYINMFGEFSAKASLMTTLTVYALILTALIISTLLDTVNDIYNSYDLSKYKPIKGFIQVIKIFVVIIIAIIIISTLLDKSPSALLAGLGAFAAVIMLVFKDSILGFVAGINISANNMLHIGDWIVMPSSGADGDVIEISLTIVKVQNFDKTIVTIPTYKLMSESFTNWRGMTESGGRRIKRSINIDIKSIKFLSPEDIERFRDYKLLTKYLDKKSEEIKKANSSETIPVNQKRLTNIGTFRVYLHQYLAKDPNIHHDMTFMVRQLQPTEKGIPLEIYCFSKNQDWVEYENIQSDIFDHIMAVLPEFDLKVYQSLSELR